jgi:hypothetical protein
MQRKRFFFDATVALAIALLFPVAGLAQLTSAVGSQRFKEDSDKPRDSNKSNRAHSRYCCPGGAYGRCTCGRCPGYVPPRYMVPAAVAGGAAATAYGVQYYQRDRAPARTPVISGPRGSGYFLNNEPAPNATPDDPQEAESLPNPDADTEPVWVDKEMLAWEERQRAEAQQAVSDVDAFQPSPYFSIAGGYGLPFAGSPAENAGSLSNGTGIRRRSSDGFALSVGIGFWASEKLRCEMRYQMISGDFNWTADYRPWGFNLARFESNWQSHQIIPTLYWHPFALDNSWHVSPFVGIGGGLAFNNLNRIRESSLDPVDSVYAKYRQRTQVSPTMMLSTGAHFRITSQLWLNVETSASYLGDISSSDRRSFANGNSEPIHPYVFRDQWMGSITVGLIAYLGS